MGSLAGALYGLGNENGQQPGASPRPGGVILSVRIANPGNEHRVIAALQPEGAADVEQADGEWRDGQWVDFDPVATPRLVERTSH